MNAKITDISRFEFGLSPLHARIRFLGCILNIAYKLPVRQWQVYDKAKKEVIAANKKKIQNAFWNEMGLLVDKPKHGHGNTNDGNTARRIFRQPEKTAIITGINVDILKRFKVIVAIWWVRMKKKVFLFSGDPGHNC